jgi:MFS superfamily sulfate permease-like transporter
MLAGATLAAVAIPEQMATARLAGFAPQFGFFAFLAGAVAFLVFGVGRQVSVGADSTVAPIFAGALAVLAASGSPHYAALAAVLALMVGVIVTLAGALRMSWIGNLLSTPITVGFLAGIAIHIIVSQAPTVLGLPSPTGDILHRVMVLFVEAPHANALALAISGGVFAIIATCHRVSARLPGPIFAVALATGIVANVHFGGDGVALLGPVSLVVPTLSFPALQFADGLHLIPLALLIAMVVMMQTATTSRAFPPAAGAPDVAGDFVGVGVGNVLAGLIGAFPINASPPRTTIVAEGGGKSQISGLTAALIVVALSAFGAGLLARTPQAALSGVLIFIACRLIRTGEVVQILSRSPTESALVATTIIGIIVFPIEVGAGMGIALSLLQGVWSSARVRISTMRQIPGTTIWWPIGGSAPPVVERIPGVIVLGFQAPLSFLNAEAFSRQFMEAVTTDPGVKLAILEGSGIVGIDFTAAGALQTVVGSCHNAGVAFALARLESPVAQAALTRLGLRAIIGEERIFDSVAEAIDALGPKVHGR